MRAKLLSHSDQFVPEPYRFDNLDCGSRDWKFLQAAHQDFGRNHLRGEGHVQNSSLMPEDVRRVGSIIGRRTHLPSRHVNPIVLHTDA
jgi:hypothetical protein